MCIIHCDFCVDLFAFWAHETNFHFIFICSVQLHFSYLHTWYEIFVRCFEMNTFTTYSEFLPCFNFFFSLTFFDLVLVRIKFSSFILIAEMALLPTFISCSTEKDRKIVTHTHTKCLLYRDRCFCSCCYLFLDINN